MSSNAEQILDDAQGEMSGVEFEEFLRHVAEQGREAGYAMDVVEAAQARVEINEMLS